MHMSVVSLLPKANVEKLEAEGAAEEKLAAARNLLQRAESLKWTLPPRLGGVLALLEKNDAKVRVHLVPLNLSLAGSHHSFRVRISFCVHIPVSSTRAPFGISPMEVPPCLLLGVPDLPHGEGAEPCCDVQACTTEPFGPSCGGSHGARCPNQRRSGRIGCSSAGPPWTHGWLSKRPGSSKRLLRNPRLSSVLG